MPDVTGTVTATKVIRSNLAHPSFGYELYAEFNWTTPKPFTIELDLYRWNGTGYAWAQNQSEGAYSMDDPSKTGYIVKDDTSCGVPSSGTYKFSYFFYDNQENYLGRIDSDDISFAPLEDG